MCRPHYPLESLALQLPYQAVIQPDRMLSIVHLINVRVVGDTPQFFSLLRVKRFCCTFFTTLSVWVVSTAVSLMWIGRCSLCCFLKSTIISFVLLMLSESLFS